MKPSRIGQPRSARGLVAVLVALLSGCATSSKPPTWEPGMGSWFSSDPLDPGNARREWTREDEERLLRQMGYADTVAIGTLRLVAQYTPENAPGQLTLAFQPEEILFGSLTDRLDGDGTLPLHPAPGQRQNLDELTGSRFLLFLKQEGKELRWASYRPSARLLNEVRSRYKSLKKHQSGS